MYVWLAEDKTCRQGWEQARLYDKAAEADGVYNRKELSSDRLDDYMAFCLLAGKYAEGIEEFHKYAKILNARISEHCSLVNLPT